MCSMDGEVNPWCSTAQARRARRRWPASGRPPPTRCSCSRSRAPRGRRCWRWPAPILARTTTTPMAAAAPATDPGAGGCVPQSGMCVPCLRCSMAGSSRRVGHQADVVLVGALLSSSAPACGSTRSSGATILLVCHHICMRLFYPLNEEVIFFVWMVSSKALRPSAACVVPVQQQRQLRAPRQRRSSNRALGAGAQRHHGTAGAGPAAAAAAGLRRRRGARRHAGGAAPADRCACMRAPDLF